jgi:hypothetical protein
LLRRVATEGGRQSQGVLIICACAIIRPVLSEATGSKIAEELA